MVNQDRCVLCANVIDVERNAWFMSHGIGEL